MKIQVQQTTTVEREVELPAFFTDGIRFMAFIETSQIYLFWLRDHISVTHKELNENDVASAASTMQPITEEEFMEKYNAAVKVLSLTPRLVFHD